jgi:hypothetical protein
MCLVALLLLLAVSASLVPAVSSDSKAATSASGEGQQPVATGQHQQQPDTNVLCVSMCGTCPAVCSSPPPPSPSSSGGEEQGSLAA